MKRNSIVIAAALVAGSLSARAGLAATNLLYDPSFENVKSNYSYFSGGSNSTAFGGTAVITPTTASVPTGWDATLPNIINNPDYVQAHTGATAAGFDGTIYMITGDNSGSGTNSIETDPSYYVAANVGDSYTLSAQVKGGNPNSGTAYSPANLEFDWFNSSGGALTPTKNSTGTLGSAGPTTFTYSAIAPAGAVKVGVLFSSTSNYSVDNFSLVDTTLPYTWRTNGSGDYNAPANWGVGVPNGIGATASFLSAITANNVVYTTAPITVGTMIFNNSFSYSIAGAVGTSLTLQVANANALVDVQVGTQEINVPLVLASNTTFQTDAASANLIIANPMTINSGIALTTTGTGTVTYQSTVTLQSGATMAIASSTYAHALTLGASSAATIATTTGAKTVLQVDSLSLGSGSTLNVSNNDLLIHNANLGTVSGQVASGFTGGGITSSAIASDPKNLTTLGVVQPTAATTIDGQSVGTGDVFVKYTYFGDANLDGAVDGSDYTKIDAGFNSGGTLTGWQNGDFNYDHVIDGSDYTLIDNTFNTQGASLGTNPLALVAENTAQIAGGSSAVPEPTTLGLLGIGALGLLGRRRK